jgi:REP element-mobilizing transposase RayT
MAYKNTVREDDVDAYYHVYNRGLNKMNIFLDDMDYRYFEKILARCLVDKKEFDKFSRQYANYYDEVKLLAYCLMPNHFHLLLHQREQKQVEKFMNSLAVAYSMYFNKKYNRKGPLFESKYKSVRIRNDEQLEHVSRYIHLNPASFRTWDYSSYSDYIFSPRDWVSTDLVLSLLGSKNRYLEYVDDYEAVNKANKKYFREIGEV